MEILGVAFNFSISESELRKQIASAGWRIDQEKFDTKKDRYTVKAVAPRGDKLERNGKTERLALANLLLAIKARSSNVKLGRWRTTFTDQIQAIAEAYSKAPVYTAKASEPFMALAKDCERRADVLARHLEIEIVNDPEPYKSAEKMIDDIRKRRKLVVSRAGTQHPIWSEQQVVAYRICHDVLGYAAANSGWDWPGENEAFAHHAHLLGEQAQQALFTESIAVAAYVTFYHAYGPQKVAVFPQFMKNAQGSENPHKGWIGVHPEESYPPIEMPEVKPIVSSLDEGLEKLADADTDTSGWADPNYGWRSGIEPIQDANGLTIKQLYGDPLGEEEGWQMANLLNRPWEQADDPQLTAQMATNVAEGGPAFTDREFEYIKTQLPTVYEQMKQAITNAIRAVLLSPKTALSNNAILYQSLKDVPSSSEDPHEYHGTIDAARRRYNVERYEEMNPGHGEEAPSHRAYQRFMKPFVRWVAETKQLPIPEATKLAQNTLDDWRLQIEDELEEQEEGKPADKRLWPWQIDSQASEQIAGILQALLKARRQKEDYAVPSGPLQQIVSAQGVDGDAIQDSSQVQDIPDMPGLPGPRRYPGVIYGHLVAMTRVAPHLDDLLKAALEDVHNHDGAGHHFRATALKLQIPGIGPKVLSFAWLLLQPLTSQLATIDVHMMRVMGQSDDAPDPRDYFGQERAFRARLDALGYDHLPTGLGQWLVWDHERTGGGTHQDHSSLAVLNPTPWGSVDWHDLANYAGKEDWGQVQPWWAQTQPIGEDVMDQYMNQLAPKTPAKAIPYQGMPKWGIGDTPDAYRTTSKLAWTQPQILRTPYFIHPETGEQITGLPGETIMSAASRTLGLSVPEVWNYLTETGKV